VPHKRQELLLRWLLGLLVLKLLLVFVLLVLVPH
jgi:hypothetical protein